jgi:hypothetical protein
MLAASHIIKGENASVNTLNADNQKNGKKQPNRLWKKIKEKIMKKLENQLKKFKKEWKFYFVMMGRPFFITPFVIGLILTLCKDFIPVRLTVIGDWLGKGLFGASITLLFNEFNGNPHIIKLLKKLSEIHMILDKWKTRIDKGETILKTDIDYPINSIIVTQGEYYDDYEIINIVKENNYISEMKNKIEGESKQEEKENLAVSLIQYIETLEAQGLSNIRDITGTTETYFSTTISQQFADKINKPNPIYIPKRKKKK